MGLRFCARTEGETVTGQTVAVVVADLVRTSAIVADGAAEAQRSFASNEASLSAAAGGLFAKSGRAVGELAERWHATGTALAASVDQLSTQVRGAGLQFGSVDATNAWAIGTGSPPATGPATMLRL